MTNLPASVATEGTDLEFRRGQRRLFLKLAGGEAALLVLMLCIGTGAGLPFWLGMVVAPGVIIGSLYLALLSRLGRDDS